MSEKKIGLIIAGAGALIPQELALAYHLIEDKGITPTVLAGTSSGSLSSIFLNGVLQNKAGKGNLSWDVLKKVLFNFANDKVYKNSALLDPTNDKDLEKICGTISHMISDNTLEKILDVIKLVEELVQDNKNIEDVVSAVLKAWKNGYLFDTEPLKEILTKYVNGDNYIGYKTFEQCFIPTYISAVNDVSGKTHRFYSKNKEDAQCNPVDILLASVAIPVAFPSQKVKNITYIDGGTATDDIPVEDMIQDGLFDEVYIVAPQAPGLVAGYQHIMPQMPLVSNLLFTIQVSHAAIIPFQLARALNLVHDKTKAFYYSPALAKTYNMLDFTGQILEEQFNQSLSWARDNKPRVVKKFLSEIGFPVQ